MVRVAETGLLWGARRCGVLVHALVDDEHQRRLRVGPVLELLVPCTMLQSLDDAIVDVETDRLWAERCGAALRHRSAIQRDLNAAKAAGDQDAMTELAPRLQAATDELVSTRERWRHARGR